MKLTLEPELRELGQAFAAQDIPLYAVGGFVRDRLLGRAVYDLDVAAGAAPEQVEAICRQYPQLEAKPRSAGLAALTLTFPGKSGPWTAEYTAFRRESYRRDGSHRPVFVESGASLEEDALRRDFTVNALYARLTDGEVLDPLGMGQADLEARRLRTTRDSDEVFAEDGLRLLRLARFACQLGFTVEGATWQGACRQINGLLAIVPERCGQELARILLSEAGGALAGLQLLERMGALGRILPELAPDCVQRGIAAAIRTPPELGLRLAALMWGVKGEQAGDACLRLGYGRVMARRVERLAQLRGYDARDPAEARWFLAKLGRPLAGDWVSLCRADDQEDGIREGSAAHWQRTLDKMEEEGIPFTPENLALKGGEIAHAMGEAPGPRTGRMKQALWKQVVQRRVPNEPDALYHTIQQLNARPEGWDGAQDKEENP